MPINAQITLQEEILEKYFRMTTPKEATVKQEAAKPIPGPREGVPYYIDPLKFDWNLFQEPRQDAEQEKTRQRILEAKAKVEAQPEKYGKPFKTLMPDETFPWNYVSELVDRAEELGDHVADKFEWALEVGQRIQNGESWEDVCNNPDTAKFYRLVQWEKGYYRLVGGSCKSSHNYPASDVSFYDYNSNDRILNTVPLVVL